MDYLFYGEAQISREENTTIVLIRIDCEPDEDLRLYALNPVEGQNLVYAALSVERDESHLTTSFKSPNNQVFLFTIAGQSNETAFPFEVTYAVYGGEVIHLSENDVVS